MRPEGADTQRIERMRDEPIEGAQGRLQDMDGGSIGQMGRIIDMIEDLSEAGKSCLEAEHCDSAIVSKIRSPHEAT